MHEIFAIEQVGIHPRPAVFKEPPTLRREVIFTKMLGHLLSGAIVSVTTIALALFAAMSLIWRRRGFKREPASY